MRQRANKNAKFLTLIGTIGLLAAMSLASGCSVVSDTPAAADTSGLNSALRAGAELETAAAVRARQRQEAAAEERRRRVGQRRFLGQIGESNCYVAPRKQAASAVAMGHMLREFDGEFYSPGGHGGDGGGGGGGGC